MCLGQTKTFHILSNTIPPWLSQMSNLSYSVWSSRHHHLCITHVQIISIKKKLKFFQTSMCYTNLHFTYLLTNPNNTVKDTSCCRRQRWRHTAKPATRWRDTAKPATRDCRPNVSSSAAARPPVRSHRRRHHVPHCGQRQRRHHAGQRERFPEIVNHHQN